MKVDMAISKWIYDANVPFNVVNSPFFQRMLDVVAGIGPRQKGANIHDLRGYLLRIHYEVVQKFIGKLNAQFWLTCKPT